MADTLRTIKLYGALGAKFGREFKMAVQTPAEAVQALCSQLPGLRQYLTKSKDEGVGFAVFVGKRNVGKEELNHLAEPGDIRIAPILMGSKNAGIFQIILGIVLVVIGVIAYAYGYAPLGQALIGAGISMIIGGVVQMLMPHPKARKGSERPEDEPSYAFNGPLNTQAQGHPVPIVYGRILAGSAVVSAGITLDDSSTATTPAPSTPYIGGGTLSTMIQRVIYQVTPP